MSHTFEHPEQFLIHLESKLKDLHTESDATKVNLLHASAHAIRYLIESQHVLSNKFYELANLLNQSDTDWAHKLAALYGIMEAGVVTPEQMQTILVQEVCKKSHV